MNIEELRHNVAVKEAELAAIYRALVVAQSAYDDILKQYEEARDAVNDAKAAYIEEMKDPR